MCIRDRNETVVQIETSDRNHRIDVEDLRLKLDELGIEFMHQREDIYDVEALLRTWRDNRLREFEILRRLPRGVSIRRPATADERLAYGIKGDATYLAFIDNDGDLASEFEFPEE